LTLKKFKSPMSNQTPGWACLGRSLILKSASVRVIRWCVIQRHRADVREHEVVDLTWIKSRVITSSKVGRIVSKYHTNMAIFSLW